MLGADPNIKAKNGRSCLMSVMGWHGWGFDRIQDMLLLKGERVDGVTEDGWTELGFAAQRGNVYAMRRLIALGADPRMKTPKGTPLEIAFEEGNSEAIEVLRAFGIQDELPYRQDPVWNIHQAAKLGDLAALEKMLEEGGKIDCENSAGDSPLMSAIGKKQVKAARFLIGKGADIQFRNPKNGWTPLFVTIIWDFHDMTLLREDLLKAGADPNVIATSGQPLLMRALWHEPTMPLKQLVAHGVDLTVRDEKGRTAVEVAEEDGKKATVQFLKEQVQKKNGPDEPQK